MNYLTNSNSAFLNRAWAILKSSGPISPAWYNFFKCAKSDCNRIISFFTAET